MKFPDGLFLTLLYCTSLLASATPGQVDGMLVTPSCFVQPSDRLSAQGSDRSDGVVERRAIMKYAAKIQNHGGLACPQGIADAIGWMAQADACASEVGY